VGERGLRHLKNECYNEAEQREDYIDINVNKMLSYRRETVLQGTL